MFTKYNIYVLVFLVMLYVFFGHANDMPLRLSAAELKNRRLKIRQIMGPNSVAIFINAQRKMRSRDTLYRYRHDRNFYYLTGYMQSGAALMLVPQNSNIDEYDSGEILFITQSSGLIESDDEDISLLKQQLGFDVVLPMDDFNDLADKVVAQAAVLYYSSFPQEFIFEPVSKKRYFVGRDVKENLQNQHENLKLASLDKAVAEMRKVKSAEEVALMQRAVDITCLGLREAVKSAQPGMYEYELQAIVEYLYTRSGAEAPAFGSIIASGPNSIILHHQASTRKMEDGDVVVMDVGAEYRGYCADVTRTIPVNGKFTAAQRSVYELVLEAQHEALKEVKPGAPFHAANKRAQEVLTQGLLKLGIIKNERDARKYSRHPVSHNLGLDAHDVGNFDPLSVGQVITMEPGIYIPAGNDDIDKKYWNLSVRIEDDVLVTENGYKILSDCIPRQPNGIERLMKEKGLGNLPLDR